jgi:hypothetical protein
MENDIVHLDPQVLAKWDRPVPRYTSYPTAPLFSRMGEEPLQKKLIALDQTEHVPILRLLCCIESKSREAKRLLASSTSGN